MVNSIFLRLQPYFTYLKEMFSGRRARGEQMAAAARNNALMDLINLNQPCMALDLGNGWLRPQSYLLRKDGHTVVGIDLVNRPARTLSEYAYRFCRKIFCHQIGTSSETDNNLMLVAGDVTMLPFASGTFDLASSQAAFEHFLNVELAVSELQRVLKPGGVAWISIHLYSSFSGGHDIYVGVTNITTLPKGFTPWGHLLNPDYKSRIPLNRWRSQQYIDCFKKYFSRVSWHFDGNDGAEFMTSRVSQLLGDYSRSELTSNLKLIVQK
jgi:SAM-dependent methyltransferase